MKLEPKNILNKEMTRKEFLAFSMVAVAGIFGVVGLIKELSSHAASPTANSEAENGTISPPAGEVSDINASGGHAIQFGNHTATTFTLGITKPTLLDPDNPTSQDTVGAAFGWNGVSLTVLNGDQIIPANTTWNNKLIHGNVTFTNESSQLINSVIDGRAPGNPVKQGLLLGENGGYAERCTIRASATAACNYLNGLYTSGSSGNWTLNRCDISHVVDATHMNGSGWIKMTGCQMHDYSFWDNDPTHATDTYHPYWSHADTAIQRLSGSGSGDWLEGNSVQAFFDTTGVTWSGGSWGSGTASGGTIGTPSTALNGGYPQRNYANLISYTNVQPYIGMTILNNWLDGGSYPSGMVQMTVAGAHSFRLEGNRFGLGCKAGGSSNRMYLCSYPSNSSVDFGTAPNIFDSIADVPSSLRGTPLMFTSSGANVVPSNFA
jgi:hypothetical protein